MGTGESPGQGQLGTGQPDREFRKRKQKLCPNEKQTPTGLPEPTPRQLSSHSTAPATLPSQSDPPRREAGPGPSFIPLTPPPQSAVTAGAWRSPGPPVRGAPGPPDAPRPVL